jgi:hypothetical protein
MSATVNTRLKIKHDTTENWNNAVGFIPLPGELIVYDDYETKTYQVEEYGEMVTKTVNIPNVKVGTGNAYVQDLAFINDDIRDIVMQHIHDYDVHVTLQEKVFWNNKVNIGDDYDKVHGEVLDELLIFDRN